MKGSLKQEIARQRKILANLEAVADTLPDVGPVPWHVTAIKTGEVYFAAAFQFKVILEVMQAFGREDWKRGKRSYSKGWDYVKTLSNGVVITIEDAEHLPDSEEAVDPERILIH